MERKTMWRIGAGLLVAVVLLGLYLYTANTVPFCTPNFERSAAMLQQDLSIEQLHSQYPSLDTIIVTQAPASGAGDLGDTIILYTADENRFWLVDQTTITGDQVYGPYSGEPRTCQFYPGTF